MERLLAALKAAGEPTRLRLLALLAESELSVSDLTRILGQSQPRVSRHLRLLLEAGLVERYQEGTWVFYRFAEAGDSVPFARVLMELLPDEDATLARDRSRLEEIRRQYTEQSAAYFRENAADWDRIRALHVREEEVDAEIAALFGEESVDNLLDIGTGTGSMLQLFAGRSKKAVGIDLSPDMLNVARANLSGAATRHCQVRSGDMYALPFADESFDGIVIHQVLHYAENPQAAIHEAARVLAPGGRLLVADFAPHNIEALREEHAHRRLGFAHEEIEGWLGSEGLDCVANQDLPGKELTVSLWLATRPVLSAAEKETVNA